MPQPLSDSQYAWLQLASVAKVKPGDWLRARESHRHDDIPLSAPDFSVLKSTFNESNTLTIRTAWVERAIDWLQADEQHFLICIDDDAYPDALRALTHPPLILFVRGNTGRLVEPQVAIVGSRRASHYGKEVASMLADALCQAGLAITSGLAAGIDAAAHRGSLSSGRAIAVTGTGPDTVYPRQHIQLADDIVRCGGAVVSEFFPGTGPRPFHFPRRNRIIAGMTSGTVVVEAGFKSGTLITANLAADLGKEVFAVPGSITHAQSEGCHALIRQGATLVTCARDICDELGMVVNRQEEQSSSAEKRRANCLATDKLLASVDCSVTAIDVIAQRNALPVSAVMAALLEYELRGLVTAVPGGYVRLRGK
ncbi:DNA-processing protein DprA [Alteromonas sp. CYL-A6]|uniref:DNA-processing protein DprA n=1 Tax=Alteromonas nitratireducens TaxID=3390813 RepID=UPI0034BB96C0